MPAGYTAGYIQSLVASLGAADVSAGADKIAAAIGRPPAPGRSLAGRGLPSLDTYVYNDGSSSTLASTYDANGNLTSQVFGNDNDANGVMDQTAVSTYTYERDGASLRVVEAAQVDNDADGVADFRYTAARTYDERGHIALSVFEADNDADGTADDRVVIAYTYDARGNLTQLMTAFGIPSPGLPAYRVVDTYTYDARGNLTSDVIDNGADGVLDGIITYTNTYDSQGRLARVLYEQDYVNGTLPDGDLDVIETFTYTYDTRGDLTRFVIHGDFDADGVNDLIWTFDYSYDVRGNLTQTAEEAISFFADGTTSTYRAATADTYDARGNLVSSAGEYDFDGDGVVDASYIRHLVY